MIKPRVCVVRSAGVIALASTCVLCVTSLAQSVEPAMESPAPVESTAVVERCLAAGSAVDFSRVPLLSFTRRGVLLNQPGWNPDLPPPVSREPEPDPTRGPGCSFTVTHSAADFMGGAYNVQAGMGQGESAAVTFVLQASQFPIVIRSTEAIWATSGATVNTTTRYAVSWYAGLPTTGTLIASFESDGVILPNINLPIGSSAVNVQVIIDSQDPEQIVIPLPSDGTNAVTAAVKIVQHNNQTQNPCTTAPPTSSNAFLTTDTNGLGQPTRNWLFGLNCGAFGCPPNGGWATFQQLNFLCRPSGDWNIRLTYEQQSCAPPTGACCATTGNCTIVTGAQCQQSGGTYRGDNTTCATANCPVPTQACCFASNQSCVDLTPSNCQGFGGVPAGFGTFCSTYICFPVGACCLPSGACVDNTTPSTCSAQGGSFRGNATLCSGQNCPLPTGACCGATGFCAELLQSQCNAVGGSWKGPLTTCADNNHNGVADLCETAPCPGDFNNDRARNTSDLAVLLGNFGSNVPPGTGGDMNNNGVVNTADLTTFLGVFGVPCP